jgi:2-keto-4-pentenoate hydratase/2-oxohepta-3-ene-1,7-dioic acid hydratase in catechol pathway
VHVVLNLTAACDSLDNHYAEQHADEGSPALTALHGSVCINDSKVADCNGTKMQFSLPEAIAFVSQGEQLHSGELFGSGTSPGGSGLENGRWINPGDTLTLSIDGIGSLTNKIESDHTVSWQ